ncbi:MAG: MOSC domain-containing protein [Acidimicrobiia bacterium]|nr:MOSC domain-containing protein [Acidimicrobiia bacterium]MDH5289907.1 MOSC domain-containing protein [Acidimicrobiia bacterium]
MSTVNSGPAAVGPEGRYRFSPTDVERTLQHLGLLWRLHTDGIARGVLDKAGVHPIGAEMTLALARVVGPDRAGGGDLQDLGQRAAEASASWSDTTRAQVLNATWLRLLDVAERLEATGAHLAHQGEVVQLARSGGGVPKAPVADLGIGWAGADGDRQANRKHHGRPWQALCLWSADVIDTLRAEGHPVMPGRAGENVTVRGLDWAAIRPGVRLRLGSAECVVSAWAEPCRNIADCFASRDFRRIDASRGPVARAYATVTRPGSVSAGDPILAGPL